MLSSLDGSEYVRQAGSLQCSERRGTTAGEGEGGKSVDDDPSVTISTGRWLYNRPQIR